MNYKVTKQTQADESIQLDKPLYMDAGIHENCILDKIEVDTTANGNNFIAFYFSNEAGHVLSHTEWEPKSEDPLVLEQKSSKLIERITQIATKFISIDQFIFEAKDFVDFCKKTKYLIEKNSKPNTKVRLKAVYNKSGFITLPGYAKFQFIENMSTPKEVSKIRILSIDLMTRPQTDWKPKSSTGSTSLIQPVQQDDPFADMNSPF